MAPVANTPPIDYPSNQSKIPQAVNPDRKTISPEEYDQKCIQRKMETLRLNPPRVPTDALIPQWVLDGTTYPDLKEAFGKDKVNRRTVREKLLQEVKAGKQKAVEEPSNDSAGLPPPSDAAVMASPKFSRRPEETSPPAGDIALLKSFNETPNGRRIKRHQRKDSDKSALEEYLPRDKRVTFIPYEEPPPAASGSDKRVQDIPELWSN
ncbi:unnamed protein product [Somion occarium]|uniref:Uncharacterized protein n=1 Tax=Somion occarium TaxID=3059160 RepID=A0ABP1EBK1_9APHY